MLTVFAVVIMLVAIAGGSMTVRNSKLCDWLGTRRFPQNSVLFPNSYSCDFIRPISP